MSRVTSPVSMTMDSLNVDNRTQLTGIHAQLEEEVRASIGYMADDLTPAEINSVVLLVRRYLSWARRAENERTEALVALQRVARWLEDGQHPPRYAAEIARAALDRIGGEK